MSGVGAQKPGPREPFIGHDFHTRSNCEQFKIDDYRFCHGWSSNCVIFQLLHQLGGACQVLMCIRTAHGRQLGGTCEALLSSRTAHGWCVCQMTYGSAADDSGDIITFVCDI
jgi:hypothetical protein